MFRKTSRCKIFLGVSLTSFILLSLAFAFYYARSSFQIDLYQGQLGVDRNSLSSFEKKVSVQQNEIIALQLQNSSLSDIINLAKKQVIFDRTVTVENNGPQLVSDLDAKYAGFLSISLSNVRGAGYIYILDAFPGYSFSKVRMNFSADQNFRVPILPGSVSLFVANESDTPASYAITVDYQF